MRSLLLILSLSLINISTSSAKDIVEEVYTPKYMMSQSKAFAIWHKMGNADNKKYPRCTIAIDAARNHDAYMSQIAWSCYKKQYHLDDIKFEEAYTWLQQSYTINTPTSAIILGDLHRDGFLDQAPDYTKAIEYYENGIQWSKIASKTSNKTPVHNNVNNKLDRLKKEISCANSELTLFGIKIKCAKQNALEQALSQYNLPIIKNHPEEKTVYYNALNITRVPSVLIVRFTANGYIANLEYIFHPKKGNKKYFYSLVKSMVDKYGVSEKNVQRPDFIRSRIDANWHLSDGISINYRANNSKRHTLTYFNPYRSKLRHWYMKQKKTENKTALLKPTIKTIPPVDLSGF